MLVRVRRRNDTRLHVQAERLLSIVYDGDGNRVSETVGGATTRYLYDFDFSPSSGGSFSASFFA